MGWGQLGGSLEKNQKSQRVETGFMRRKERKGWWENMLTDGDSHRFNLHSEEKKEGISRSVLM